LPLILVVLCYVAIASGVNRLVTPQPADTSGGGAVVYMGTRESAALGAFIGGVVGGLVGGFGGAAVGIAVGGTVGRCLGDDND
jgi:hypothetical protein